MPDSTEPRRGRPFRPVRGVQFLWRTAFATTHRGHRYVVAVNYFDLDERIHLYRDGEHLDERRNKARFVLPDGRVDAPRRQQTRIEARRSMNGLRYVRLVDATGARELAPMPGTAEAWRDAMDQRYPAVSRAVGAVSWVVLAVAFVTQVVPPLTRVTPLLDLVDEATGWRPPAVPDLPATVDTVLVVLAVVAVVDRALRRRYNPLLD